MGKYVPGQRYKIRSINDMVRLATRLPQERAEVMVNEVARTILYAAALHDLTDVPWITRDGYLTWIDDDKHQKNFTLMTTDGEPLMEFRTSPAP